MLWEEELFVVRQKYQNSSFVKESCDWEHMARKKGFSKLLNLIVQSLKKRRHNDMLYWDSEQDNIFVVRMIHKKWKFFSQKHISLFKEYDKIMKKEDRQSIERERYCEKTKGRFRAGMKRLIQSKYIEKVKEKTEDCKSVRSVYYKILNQDKTVKKSVETPNKTEGRNEIPEADTDVKNYTNNNNTEVNEVIPSFNFCVETAVCPIYETAVDPMENFQSINEELEMDFPSIETTYPLYDDKNDVKFPGNEKQSFSEISEEIIELNPLNEYEIFQNFP